MHLATAWKQADCWVAASVDPGSTQQCKHARHVYLHLLCFYCLDGARWPNLLNHLSARYRQYATGAAPQASQLIHTSDRKVLSASHVAAQLG